MADDADRERLIAERADLEHQLALKKATRKRRAQPPTIVPVPSDGPPARSDRHVPLMASQEFLWLISWSTPPDGNNVGVWELPPTVTTAEITNAFALLVERYEALRTTFGLSIDGVPYQRVAVPQPVVIPAYDVSDDPQVALNLMSELTAGVLQPHGCRPYHAAILADGDTRWIMLALSHFAADGYSAGILRRTFLQLLAGEALPPAGRQPAEQALIESSPQYRPRLDSAMSHFEETVRRAPSRLFPRLPHEVPPGSCTRARLRSSTVDAATKSLATQLHTTPASVYLTIFAACLTTLTRNPHYAIYVNSHGRFDDAMEDSVGCFFGRGLVGGSTDESASFLELLKNIQVATLSAMQLSVFSYCDAEEARVRVERARGRPLPLACSFDYQATPSTGSPGADLADGDELTVEPTEHPIANNELTLFVGAGDGESTLEFVGSSAALTDDEMADVARAAGQVIVTLSADPRARDSGLAELLRRHGLPVHTYGPELTYSDASWVDLRATRELLVSHESVQDALVVPVGDDDEPVLVAYVVAKSEELHAWQLRQHILDQLEPWPGVAVPHRFRIVEASPPSGEQDVDAWERQTVVEEGDGVRHPSRQPASQREDVLCAAIRQFHVGIQVDVNTDYVDMGGRARLAPAVVQAVEGCGYAGLTALDLLQPCSIAALARRLTPQPPSPKR